MSDKETAPIPQLALEIRNLAHRGWEDRPNAEFLFREIGKRAQQIAQIIAAECAAPVWPEKGAPARAEMPPLGPIREPVPTLEEWMLQMYEGADLDRMEIPARVCIEIAKSYAAAASPQVTPSPAKEFYERHATNVVNVPRPGHPEDHSGWAGVRRASQARFIAKDVLCMPLWDVFDFAEKYAASRGVTSGQASQVAPSPAGVKGEDFWIDELEYQIGRKVNRNYLRTWLRAFAANLKSAEVTSGQAEAPTPALGVQWFVTRRTVKQAFRLSAEPTPVENDMLHEFLGATKWESDRDGGLLIHTLEGVMRADSGDWIIRGVKGEFYPCKPDIFAANYEPFTGAGHSSVATQKETK